MEKINNKIFILVICIFAFIKSSFFSLFGLNLFDDGESLHNGLRLLNGDVLYRDIWAIFPPADDYFPALILKIFGNSIVYFHLVESLVFILLLITLIQLLKKFLKLNSKYILLFCIVLIFSSLYVHLLFLYLFFFVALLLTLEFWFSRRLNLFFFAGVSIGIGALFRHDTALITATAILISLLLSTLFFKDKLSFKKLFLSICIFLSGIFIITSPVILWLYRNGTLNDFLYLGFIKAPQISSILSPGFHPLRILFLPLTYSNIYQIFGLFFYPFYFFIYIFTGGILFYRLIKNISLDNQSFPLLLILSFGVLMVPYGTSVIELGHLVKAGIPALILGIYFMQIGINRRLFGKYCYLFLGPFIIFLLGNIISSVWWINFNNTRIDFKQGLVFVNSKFVPGSTHPTAKTLIQTVKFIKENTTDKDYIFAAPYHAMIYFLTERKAPSKFDNFAAGFVSANEEEEIIRSIQVNNVNYAVYDPSTGAIGKKMADYNPMLHAYIMENFETIEVTEDGWLLMRRKL